MKVGIIFAMQKEWDGFFSETDKVGCSFAKGKTRKGIPYVALISGIGKVHAAIAAYKLWKEYDCSRMLSFGCAGGLSRDVHIGDIVVGDEYIYHDVFCGSPNAMGQVQGCPETFPSDYEQWGFLKGLKHGLITTGDMFVESPMSALQISGVHFPKHTPVAMDMESAAIAQVCERRSVGFTSVRVISDNPICGEKTYQDFWGQKDNILSVLYKSFLVVE